MGKRDGGPGKRDNDSKPKSIVKAGAPKGTPALRRELPRMELIGSPVSENASSRQFVNRDNLPLIEGCLACAKNLRF